MANRHFVVRDLFTLTFMAVLPAAVLGYAVRDEQLINSLPLLLPLTLGFLSTLLGRLVGLTSGSWELWCIGVSVYVMAIALLFLLFGRTVFMF